MAPSCPHCGNRVAAKSLLWSATGLSRSFGCPRCMRRLSVSGGSKVAYVGVLAMAGLACCAYDFQKNTQVLFFGLPIMAVLASLAVCRLAKVRMYGPAALWYSAVNYGILGLSACAVSFAYTQ